VSAGRRDDDDHLVAASHSTPITPAETHRPRSPRCRRFVAERILASVSLLAEHPNLGRPGRVAGTRELVVPGTPYVIPYRVKANRLEVIAVFHGRQNWPETL
jgi:toxin ParE1/3/4